MLVTMSDNSRLPDASAQQALPGGPAPDAPTGSLAIPLTPEAADGPAFSSLPPSRKLIALSAFAALLLASVGVASGWYLVQHTSSAGTERSTADQAQAVYPGIPDPSDEWRNGATKTWSMSVDSKATLTYTPDHVFVLKDRLDVTAYSYSGDTISEAWSTRLSRDDDSLYTTDAALLQWGSAWMVNGGTLYDLNTGASSPAPWGAGVTAAVVDDVAISCDANDLCTAWNAELQQLWSMTVPGTGDESPEPTSDSETRTVQPYVTRDGHRYADLQNVVIDLDTGETTTLTPPKELEKVGTIWPAQDGWVLRYTTPGVRSDQYASFTPTGTLVESYESGDDAPDSDQPIYPRREFPTLADYKSKFTTAKGTTATGTFAEADYCLTQATMSNGVTIAPPAPTTAAVYGQTLQQYCIDAAYSSSDGSIVMLSNMHIGFGSFGQMSDGVTGAPIPFEGMDFADQAKVTLVTSTYAIGYNPATGQLIGYRAAG